MEGKFSVLVLLICGVFGATEDKEKLVMEGDSLTLIPDTNKMSGFIQILWRFGDKGSVIAQYDRQVISYPSHAEIFKGRMQLDQTGSLTIRNLRLEHSGLYNLQIDLPNGPTYITFNIKVYEPPSVIGSEEAEMKTVSVSEGDPVILQINAELLDHELIVWRFGDEGKLIATQYRENKSPSPYDPDERFRGRLELDQTGSVTIKKTRTTDSGLYSVKICSNKETSYKKYIVTVSAPGLSSGATAAIVIAVLLLLVSAVVAAVGVFLYRCRIAELERKQRKYKPVLYGESVKLETKIQTDDDTDIQWLFGRDKVPLAKIKNGKTEIKTPDKRIKARLKLEEKTGDLTISDVRHDDSGMYLLKIIRGTKITKTEFFVDVDVKHVSVKPGETVTLKPEIEIERIYQIQWEFEKSLIAEFKDGKKEFFKAGKKLEEDEETGRMNEKTGELTIKNVTPADEGLYEVHITTNKKIIRRGFFVEVEEPEPEERNGENETATEWRRSGGSETLFVLTIEDTPTSVTVTSSPAELRNNRIQSV